jgi:hypothetical protein
MTEAQMGRWYMVNKDGMATLCTDRADAEKEAADAQSVWPHMGPHRAVQLVEASFEAADMATAAADGFRSAAAEVGPSLQHLHDLLYTAQRTTGDAQAQAIAEARIALSGIMTAQELSVLASRAWPKVSGVSRDEGHSRALLVFFAAEPTDDEMRAVHDTLAAPPTAQAEGWMPIKTAQQDGRTLLLGYFNSAGKWRTTRGEWMSQDYIDEYAEDPDCMSPGWYETTVEGDDGKCWPIDPTHWMPLPPPPTTSAGSGKGE